MEPRLYVSQRRQTMPDAVQQLPQIITSTRPIHGDWMIICGTLLMCLFDDMGWAGGGLC